jgi:hypothetical protein
MPGSSGTAAMSATPAETRAPGGGRNPADCSLPHPASSSTACVRTNCCTWRPGKHLRPVTRSEATGEFPVRFGHPVWQVGGAEQAGFEDFLRVEGEAVQAADEDGLVVDLDPVPEAAADLQ